MTENEKALLGALNGRGPILMGNEEELEAGARGLFLAARDPFPDAWPWSRPMDVGGKAGTHHAVTLARLVSKGWAERKQRGARHAFSGRPSYVYRITAAGRDALFNARALGG